jgi:putative Mn2+ efflux pump MntP
VVKGYLKKPPAASFLRSKTAGANIFILLVLSVATSIDALAVGVTISLITATVARAVIIIGLVTFTMSYLGVFIGKKFGHFFESRVEAVGGTVLIGIGLKILFEHLSRTN